MEENKNQKEFERIFKDLEDKEQRRKMAELEDKKAALEEASKTKDERISQLEQQLRNVQSTTAEQFLKSFPHMEEEEPPAPQECKRPLKAIATAIGKFFRWLYNHRPGEESVKGICWLLFYLALGGAAVYFFIIRGV